MSVFNIPIMIGNLKLKNRVFLAPLAGVSDIPMRRICQELGAGLTYVEMLSATAIGYKNKRTFEMMARHSSEEILGVQVTGSKAEDVAKSVEVLDKKGFDTIDINMGCPVKKVVNGGCGSGILKDPERITETLLQCRKVTDKPLSAKIRLGYTRENVNVQNTVERILNSNADMYTIHGRTRSENYATPVDLSGIKSGVDIQLKLNLQNSHNSVSQLEKNSFLNENKFNHIVSVGNGDIFCYESALQMKEKTNCDAVMISRGALGNPWIFQQILNGKTDHPTFEEWKDVVLRHIQYQEEHFGNVPLAAILMRKHLLWYAKGFQFMKSLRETLNKISTLEEARYVIEEFSKNIPKNSIRFNGAFQTEVSHKYDPKFEMDRQLDRGVCHDETEIGF